MMRRIPWIIFLTLVILIECCRAGGSPRRLGNLIARFRTSPQEESIHMEPLLLSNNPRLNVAIKISSDLFIERRNLFLALFFIPDEHVSELESICEHNVKLVQGLVRLIRADDWARDCFLQGRSLFDCHLCILKKKKVPIKIIDFIKGIPDYPLWGHLLLEDISVTDVIAFCRFFESFMRDNHDALICLKIALKEYFQQSAPTPEPLATYLKVSMEGELQKIQKDLLDKLDGYSRNLNIQSGRNQLSKIPQSLLKMLTSALDDERYQSKAEVILFEPQIRNHLFTFEIWTWENFEIFFVSFCYHLYCCKEYQKSAPAETLENFTGERLGDIFPLLQESEFGQSIENLWDNTIFAIFKTNDEARGKFIKIFFKKEWNAPESAMALLSSFMESAGSFTYFVASVRGAKKCHLQKHDPNWDSVSDISDINGWERNLYDDSLMLLKYWMGSNNNKRVPSHLSLYTAVVVDVGLRSVSGNVYPIALMCLDPEKRDAIAKGMIEKIAECNKRTLKMKGKEFYNDSLWWESFHSMIDTSGRNLIENGLKAILNVPTSVSLADGLVKVVNQLLRYHLFHDTVPPTFFEMGTLGNTCAIGVVENQLHRMQESPAYAKYIRASPNVVDFMLNNFGMKTQSLFFPHEVFNFALKDDTLLCNDLMHSTLDVVEKALRKALSTLLPGPLYSVYVRELTEPTYTGTFKCKSLDRFFQENIHRANKEEAASLTLKLLEKSDLEMSLTLPAKASYKTILVAIRRLLGLKMEDYPECPICLGHLFSEVSELPCHHEFHNRCIDQWVAAAKASKSPATCPLCRDRMERPSHLQQLLSTVRNLLS